MKAASLMLTKAFINGKWVDGKKHQQFPVFNPATQEVICEIPDMDEEDTLLAIDAAHRAFPAWSKLPAKERSDCLERWFHLIIQHQDELAWLMTTEQGKPLKEAKGEVDYGAAFVRWFAEEARRIYGDTIPSLSDGRRIWTLKQPIGVVSAITPWNFPVAMITRKCAPALAAGCTLVLKPPAETPLCALALAKLAQNAGIPDGVINVVTTRHAEAVGKVMTTHPAVGKISFTGSTAVGRKLMAQAAETVKKVSLELGGNAPFIVLDDADIDAAVSGLIFSKFRNSGQTCICPNRIYVQNNIYDAFVAKLIPAIKNLKVGPGLEADSEIGPLINEAAIAKVERHIADAKSKGAKVLVGGERHSLGGTFFQPTLLTEMNKEMIISCEETFGPVAPVFRFEKDEEAIALANDTIFGLAAYFYSKDIYRISALAENLQSGMVAINTGKISSEIVPFGGVKQSGIGREGSKYGIDEYVEIKSLCLGLES
jgi:succinate-semialdehyde dehydrogenase/glutarate-semialdehyde dehydrogenase